MFAKAEIGSMVVHWWGQIFIGLVGNWLDLSGCGRNYGNCGGINRGCWVQQCYDFGLNGFGILVVFDVIFFKNNKMAWPVMFL